jgi:sialic acid synthase SpsE
MVKTTMMMIWDQQKIYLIKIKKSNLTRNQLFSLSRETAKIFRKSLYWSTNLGKGEKVKNSNIMIRKPWKGLDAWKLESLVGKNVKKNVSKGLPLRESDFE